MFAFKLLLTPVLLGLVSLAGRRWGPTVSGWLIGLPLTAGPVVLFLALDQGTVFASRAAEGTLLGLISVTGFCLAYSWLSLRLGWLYCVLVGWGVYFALTTVLERISLPLVLAFAGVVICLVVILKLLPDFQDQGVVTKSPQWETLLRMLVGTAFVVGLTSVAGHLGPQLSGLLTTFPVFASILATFTHHFQGAASARRLLRGVVTGFFTFAIFFLMIAGLVERWGIVATFGGAILVALLMHGGSLFLLRRYNLY